MQEIGVIRKMDRLGRVVVPSHIRRELKWDDGTPLEIFADGRGVYLQTYEKSCVFCGERDNVQLFEGKHICKNCITRLQK